MSVDPRPVDYSRLQQLLSAERLGSYLTSCEGDLDATFALYEWNIDASAAALSLAAMVEVVVRNALDDQMRLWAKKRSVVDWLLQAPLDARARSDIQKAKDRAARGGRQVTHGHVVAELNLGFWRYLVSRRYYNLALGAHPASCLPADHRRGLRPSAAG